MNQLNVLMIGFPEPRAELLSSALRRSKPDAFSFSIIHDTLASIRPDQFSDSILLVCSSRSDQASVTNTARRLRTEFFFWQPIHLLVERPSHLASLGDEWAIWFHESPPNVFALGEDLISKDAVTDDRRTKLVISALTSLADDLTNFSGHLYAKNAIGSDRVRTALASASLPISTNDVNGYDELRSQMERIADAPSVSQDDLKRLMPLVVEAEMLAREENDKQPGLAAILHKLNNTLRLAVWEPSESPQLTEELQARLVCLKNRGIQSLPERERDAVQELCSKLEDLFGTLAKSTALNAKEKLDRCISQINSLTLRHRTFPSNDETSITVDRIVVVEDDLDWQSRILGILKTMLGDFIEIQTAENMAQAQDLLKDTRPALALVDLGLPVDHGTDPILDGGLELIKEFSESNNRGRRYQHRFVVLTAAENYAEAVRRALEYGVSPFGYLQKGSRTWPNELQAQIRLALRQRKTRLPNIEIFKRTRRIARVEGMEIKLDYPHWCLLSALAGSRKGMWNEPEKLANILYWNYSVNPDSRSEEAERLDAEERILEQLPHYASELNLRIAETYLKGRHEPLATNPVIFEPMAGYRLNAHATILEQADEQLSKWRQPSVLIVEDNPEWTEKIVDTLNRNGFQTRTARSVDQAEVLVADKPPDLISLDLELPRTSVELENGDANAEACVEFLRSLRQECIDCPVAVLTAIPWQDAVMLEMLREGVRVDDYLSKHSDHPTERLANSLARLWQESVSQTRILNWDSSIPLHPIKINKQSRILESVNGFSVRPSGQSRTILEVLSASPNVFVSRAELIDALYGDVDGGPDDPEEGLKQHIKRLRKAIKEATGNTIPGDEVICGDRGVYWLRGIVQ